MHGAAAGLRAVIQRLHRRCALARIRPPRHRLFFRVRAQILTLEITQLIMRFEIRSPEPRPTFQSENLHSGFAEFGGEDAARTADTDDYRIGFQTRHVRSFSWPSFSGLSWVRG